jgi:hypothetical protein
MNTGVLCRDSQQESPSRASKLMYPTARRSSLFFPSGEPTHHLCHGYRRVSTPVLSAACSEVLPARKGRRLQRRTGVPHVEAEWPRRLTSSRV